MKLKTSEKILVSILCAVLILYFGVNYLVLPAFAAAKDSLAQNATLTQEQNTARQKVEDASAAASSLKSQISKSGSAASALLPTADAETLNVWADEVVKASGLSVTTMSISGAVGADIGASSGTASGSGSGCLLNDYAQKIKGSTSSAASSAASASSGSQAGVLCVTVTLTMSGTYAQAQAFLDLVKNCGKTVVVSSFSSPISGGQGAINAVLLCYGADKLDNSDKTFTWSWETPAGKSDITQ